MGNDITNSNAGKKNGRTWLKIAIALAVMLAGSLAGVYYLHEDSDKTKGNLKDANTQIGDLQSQVAKLKIELDTTKANLRREKDLREKAELENDTLKTMFPLYITQMEVGNADENGSLVTAYGKDIQASSSMYLMPKITYVVLKPGITAELMVRLYDADGKCVTGASSPAGYSYSFKINALEPGENTIALSGWGGPDKGHFAAGTYRYEVWLGGMCLFQKSFVLK